MKHWFLVLGFCTAALLPCGTTAFCADEARETPVVRAVKRATAAVVNIHTEKTAVDRDSVFTSAPAGKSRKVNGMGTGVLIDERGYIVTNYHVVAEVDVIRAVLFDGSNYQAHVVRHDREHDLAIIKIESSRALQVMPHGTSSDLMLGETVIAVGNAYGYNHTVTVGIISALGRDVEANETQSYKNLIQTDASINPGNSGGPLLNLNGDVIGINVAIRAGAQRIGFAIPIDDVRKTVAQLMSVEQLDHTFHGVAAHDVKSAATRMLVVDTAQPDSPAARAGFKPGDVVLKVAEKPVMDGVDFERFLLGRPAGEPVAITVRRGEHTETVQLALTPLHAGRSRVPEYVARANNDNPDGDRFWRVLGVKLGPVPLERARSIPSRYKGGLVVLAVRPGSAADRSGIKSDDILVGLWGFETLKLDDVNWTLAHPEQAIEQANRANTPDEKDRYYVVRARQPLFGQIPHNVIAESISNTVIK